MLQSFLYKRPTTLEEAALAVKEGAQPLAGGTDLVPLLKCEVRAPQTLAHLGAVTELTRVERRGEAYFIGAMVGLQVLAEHPEIQAQFPALAAAARAVASPQIRAIGTIGGNVMQDRRCLYFNQSWQWRQSMALCFKTGGNVCHQAPASPCCRAPYYSDVATALCAYGAKAELYENAAPQCISVAELCGRHAQCNATSASDSLLVTGFLLPIAQNACSAFIKESVRAAIDFPTFNAAGYITSAENVLTARLVVGAINSAPVELASTQAMLTSKAALLSNGEAIRKAALEEMSKHAVLVREAAISVKVKRASFQGVFHLLDALAQQL